MWGMWALVAFIVLLLLLCWPAREPFIISTDNCYGQTGIELEKCLTGRLYATQQAGAGCQACA